MNFRKVVFALATAGLGLTGVASAQITCTTAAITTSPQMLVRVEGTTELVSGVTIGGCSNGAGVASYTVTVASPAGISNVNVPNQTFTDAQATFFGGTAVNGTLSNGTLTFTTTTLGATPASGIVISGVRVNAASQAVNMSITQTVTPGAGVVFSGTAGNAVPVAYTQAGLAKPSFQGFANKSICTAGTAVVPLGQAVISNGFAGSLAGEGTGDLFIQVTFGNLAPAASYYVLGSLTGSSVLTIASATAVSNNTSTTAAPTTTIGPSGGTQVGGAVALTVSNGSASVLYHIGTPGATTQGFIVPLFAVATSGATVGVTSSPTVMATFVGNGISGAVYDQFAASQNEPVVTASATATALTGLPWPTTVGGIAVTTGGGELTSCATTLLFPYVLNSGGYDTGMALTNASAGTSVSQDGTCSVMFYGTGVPSTNPYVTGPITAGTVGTFTVSSVASGFQGYAIATCNFQDAHGFSFITDGYGQPGHGYSEGYLAPITSANGSPVTGPF